MISKRAFEALADPTRRHILSLLREGPMTAGEIAGEFRSAWPTISRHLAILRDARVITSERDGRSIRYELDVTVLQHLAAHILQWTNTRIDDDKAQSRAARGPLADQRHRIRKAR